MTIKNKKANQFDIVIPVGVNDESQISDMIEHTKRNVIGYRNIYLVVTNPLIRHNGCITIDERDFLFTKKDVISIFNNKEGHYGWYLQQILKLYAWKCIEGILDDYLVLDGDTYFLKPTTFFENGKALHCFENEYNEPYFIHMLMLHPSLTKITKRSGVCHHMIFNKKILEHLFEMVEQEHKQKPDYIIPFWKLFLKNVNPLQYKGSGASEYEIYFNFVHKYHKDTFKIRPLNWSNVCELPMKCEDYDYVSWHHYERKRLSYFRRLSRRIRKFIKIKLRLTKS